MAGLPGISIGLALLAPGLAWFYQLRLAWSAIWIAWLIWPALLVIGLANNDAHGVGLHYLQLYALLALPLATIIALLFAALVGWIGSIRNRTS